MAGVGVRDSVTDFLTPREQPLKQVVKEGGVRSGGSLSGNDPS